jgi:hypothetical protein
LAWYLFQEKGGVKLPEGIDTEYLEELIKQSKCKVNGMITHLQKEGFKDQSGIMINGSHLSIEYLQEKAHVLEQLLTTIQLDVLQKSGRFRNLGN